MSLKSSSETFSWTERKYIYIEEIQIIFGNPNELVHKILHKNVNCYINILMQYDDKFPF